MCDNGVDDIDKQFSMISPLPGTTPPPENDLKRIEAFLRANNALDRNSEMIDVPMPPSREVSSRCQDSSGGRYSESKRTQKTILKQHSRVGFAQCNHQQQLDSLQLSVSILTEKLESVSTYTFNHEAKLEELDQQLQFLSKFQKKFSVTQPPSTMITCRKSLDTSFINTDSQ